MVKYGSRVVINKMMKYCNKNYYYDTVLALSEIFGIEYMEARNKYYESNCHGQNPIIYH